MPRRPVALVAALTLGLLALLPVAARAGAPLPPCPPGTSPDVAGVTCVLLDKALTGVGAATTSPEADVAAQEASWLGSALERQHRLGDALPLRDAMWVGTHNSFNTVAKTPPSLSNLDSNQHVTMLDQLRLGVRSLEVDVHWLPSVWAAGAKAPVVCHGRPPGELHVGCTDEHLLADELAPVAAWLRAAAHHGDVILLYVEDQIDESAGYDASAAAIDAALGGLVYRPPAATPCPLLPLDLRRADVLAAGKQVVVMSGCGTGASAAWGATAFDDSVRAEEGNPDFAGYPACTSASVTAADYGTHLVRFYEDSTFVSAATGLAPGHRLSTDELAAMVRCGVNLYGLDQVTPGDPRLEAMVWSWAPAEPSTSADGTCAHLGGDGRFHASACNGTRLALACVVPSTGEWFVTARTGAPDRGARECGRARAGAVFAVPGSGAHQQRLAEAAAGRDVWVAYRAVGGSWVGAAA